MRFVPNPRGGYAYAAGIAPYSAGVVALPGYALVRGQFAEPAPLAVGFDRIDAHLRGVGRPRQALCALELRIPAPLTFQGFAEFNTGYRGVLAAWDLLIDGDNPIARTNVAPALAAPGEPSIFAFSYTLPTSDAPVPTFVVAGAGDLSDQARLEPSAIVARGDVSPAGLATKVTAVVQVMSDRLHDLGVDWPLVQTVNLYTVHPPADYFARLVLPRLGSTAYRGVHWYYSRPPIAELEYEMDLRAVWRDEMLR
jgi:hypothetical protein